MTRLCPDRYALVVADSRRCSGVWQDGAQSRAIHPTLLTPNEIKEAGVL